MSATVRPSKKKNLIILEIESLENQVLGAFNSWFPLTMPYLSNLSKTSTFCDHVRSSPYTTWSVASLFATQCNLPLLMTPTAKYNKANFHLLPHHRCLGDFFATAGYRLHSYMANVFIGRFKLHQRLHRWRALDAEDHQMKRDWDVFDFVAKEVLPNLTRPSEQPFVLHIANADNHAFPRYFVDSRCENRVRSYPLILRSFDCVDQILERFIEAFKRSPLAENTEMFLYGDHLLMSGIHRQIKLFEPRFVTAMFPLRPAQVIKKPLTIYDFAPTLMDVMEIDYEPKFPFGASIFSQKVGTAPGASHFQYIYRHFRDLMNWETQARCSVGSSGFCRRT
jgi:phosphoglycerol transferase MdoB-like AlkP superfamily enzyme